MDMDKIIEDRDKELDTFLLENQQMPTPEKQENNIFNNGFAVVASGGNIGGNGVSRMSSNNNGINLIQP